MESGAEPLTATTQLIPADIKFDPAANPPRFATNTDETDEIVIEKGTKVRVKVVGTRVDATEIFAIGVLPLLSLASLLMLRAPCRDYEGGLLR